MLFSLPFRKLLEASVEPYQNSAMCDGKVNENPPLVTQVLEDGIQMINS